MNGRRLIDWVSDSPEIRGNVGLRAENVDVVLAVGMRA